MDTAAQCNGPAMQAAERQRSLLELAEEAYTWLDCRHAVAPLTVDAKELNFMRELRECIVSTRVSQSIREADALVEQAGRAAVAKHR